MTKGRGEGGGGGGKRESPPPAGQKKSGAQKREVLFGVLEFKKKKSL